MPPSAPAPRRRSRAWRWAPLAAAPSPPPPPPRRRPGRRHLTARPSPAQEVADLPFDFLRAPSACIVLAARGLHGVGLWAAACACACGGDADAAGAPLALLRRAGGAAAPLRLTRAELEPLWDEWWAGAGPGLPPPLPAPGAAPPPADWRTLYAARGLALAASPAALALDAVATIAHALAALPTASSAAPLVVHLAGAAREAEAWPLLLELAPAAGRRVDAHLIGPEVPPWAHGRRVELAGGDGAGADADAGAPDTAVTLWHGLYHDVWREAGGAGGALPAPGLLAAPNAGLAAYAAWRPTLELLRAWREGGASSSAGLLTDADRANHAMAAPPRPVRVLITDYSEEAALRAAAAVDTAVGAAPGAVALNPLRAPLLRRAADNRLPAASNAFAFEFDF
jgi:hypothetical protein